jgi:arylsulfatase
MALKLNVTLPGTDRPGRFPSNGALLWYASAVAFVALVASQLVSSSRFSLAYQLPASVYESMYSTPVVEVDEPYNDELGPLNVVVFFPDDWRWDAIQDEKPGVVYTPFLTKLAKDGIRFTHNAVTSSICWISRATLFSGRYVSQHNSHRLFCPVFTLPSMWNSSWPALLQRYGGYFVGHIGKWQYRNSRVDQLFNFSYLHEGNHWYTVHGERIHANDRARNDAIAFLRARPVDRNFAVTVAFYPPKPIGDSSELGAQWEPHERHEVLYENHTFVQPYNYSDAFAYIPEFLHRGYSAHRYDTRFKTSEMYQESMRHYYALVTGVDEACKDIVAELEAQGVLNRTMIIVSADNGMMLGAHGIAGKWHPYQESIRVPLIVYDPRMAKSKRGKVDVSFTLNIDLAATILGAANLPVDPRIQGRDMADIYVKRPQEGGGPGKFGVETKPWREDFYYEFPLGEFPASTALVTRQYKYIRWSDKGKREQIFDLQNDPYELHDLMTAQPPLHLLQQVGTEFRPANVTDLLHEFRARHDVLEAQVKEPFPGEEQVRCQRGLPYA